MDERRVREGALGCPNCRDLYPIKGGVADLRPPPRVPLPVAAPTEEGAVLPGAEDEALRAAALLGLVEGGGYVLILEGAESAAALAQHVPEAEVVLAHWESEFLPAATLGATAIMVPPNGVPVQFATFRGVVARGHFPKALSGLLQESLAPGARVLVLEPEPGALAALVAFGLTGMLDAREAVVASR